MTKLFFVLSCIFLCLPAKSFQLGSSSNPVAQALGNCSITLPYSKYGNNNPSTLADIQQDFISLVYENKYCIPNIGPLNLSYLHANKQVNLGLNINYFGLPQYGELSIGVLASKRFSSYFSAGIEIDYIGILLSKEEGMVSTYAIQFGCSYFPIKNLQIAFKAYNLSFSSVQLAYNKKENIPSIFNIGLSYSFKDGIYISSEIKKEIKSKIAFNCGIEYPLTDIFTLRAGVDIQEFASPSFGLGIILQQITIDLACQYNLQLGLSSSIGLIYCIKK